jgi:MarR family transcriptional regulator, temperature-dependent positive regulator of motility
MTGRVKVEMKNAAGHLIRRLNQHSTQVFATQVQAAGLDLTPVQFAAMSAVAAQPGIDQARVAAEIAYDRATIGGVIDRLEQKGYIARTVAPHDRRARELRLTADGAAILERIRPVVSALQTDILRGLEATERRLFLELAQKVIASVEG